MKILALDAATEACGVALLIDEQIFAVSHEGGRHHATEIFSMLDTVLGQARVVLGALDCIAVSVGPGAFTGVRASVAIGQGLAFGTPLPVVAVTTLEALAFAAVREGAVRVLACLDARMGEVYSGAFCRDDRRGVIASRPAIVGPPAAVQAPPGGAFIGVGRGFAAYPLLCALPGAAVTAEAQHRLPNAADMARLAARRFAAGEAVAADALMPQYLRDNVARTLAERLDAQRDSHGTVI